MTKYAYEYGKRWNKLTPRYMINKFVAKQHVTRPIEEIKSDILSAIETSPDCGKFTESIKTQCLLYAELCHKKNQELFDYVIRGRSN